MSSYRDSKGFWHDTIEANSNNGWFYTAMAKVLGLPIPDNFALWDELNECHNFDSSEFWINRRPGRVEPPISRDEVIGIVSLTKNKGFYTLLNHFDFNMSRCGRGSKFEALKILFKIRKEHRNYVWKNSLTEAYPLAFQLLPHDVYYIKKMMGDTSFHLFPFFILYFISTILQDNTSAKNVLLVQIRGLNFHWLLKFMNYEKNIVEYYGIDHPFSKEVL